MLADLSDHLPKILGALALGVGLVALVYIGFPILILKTQRLEASPRLLKFEVDDYDWPREIKKLFTSSQKALEAEGFESVGGFFLPSAANNVKTALILFVNRESRDGAMATAMYGDQPDGPRTLYVEFSTRFADGRTVNTLNSKTLGSFPTREGVTTTRLPSIKDARNLYRIHKALMQEVVGAKAKKVLKLDAEFGGDAAQYLQEAAFRESYEAAEEAGYIRLDFGGEHFVPTVKGAFLMTWRELWPWKMIREQQMRTTERKVLERLGRS